MSNSFDKLTVLDSFIEEVNSYLPEIKASLERLAHSPADMEALEESHRCTHTIHGAASMMDFTGLAHIARGMEDILDDVKEGGAPLDLPTVNLLQRSLGRMYRLLDGIREEREDPSIVTEDDQDYEQFQAAFESQGATESAPVAYQQNGANRSTTLTPQTDPGNYTNGFSSPTSSGSGPAMPSLDDVLNSFRSSSSEDSLWPEEPAALSRPNLNSGPPLNPFTNPDFMGREPEQSLMDGANQSYFSPPPSSPPPHSTVPPSTPSQFLSPSQPEVQPEISRNENIWNWDTPTPSAIPPSQSESTPREPSLASALELLMGGSKKEPTVPPIERNNDRAQQAFESVEERVQPAGDLVEQLPMPPVQAEASFRTQANQPEASQSLPASYRQMQGEVEGLEKHAASLKSSVSQLRSAVKVIEKQRSEFKGFLDGSKDALDRMEIWAGKAMGLDLKNSPEKVRRALPLSVMWVVNSKLKKVLDKIDPIASGVEFTDEQINIALQQFQESLTECGLAFQQLQEQNSTLTLRHEAGWTEWQRMDTPEVPGERVTFERRGDPEALRNEIEAQVREELRRSAEADRLRMEQQVREEVRQEFEDRSITLASRAELEQHLREEIRQEFEGHRQMREQLSGGLVGEEALKEIEARLRNEIEIQVRRDFLSQIASASASEAAEKRQKEGNDHRLSVDSPHHMQPLPKAAETPTPPPPNSTIDYGDEAADIFRSEAEEHLQTISMNVAALEKSPQDLDLIQSIRRATHTLKGAAGMMGFRPIADLSHLSEDLLDSIMEGETTITSEVLGIILDTAETLDLMITGKEGEQSEEVRLHSLHDRYTALLGANSPAHAAFEEEIEEDHEASTVTSVVDEAQGAETNAQRAARSDLSVRVRLQKLDELVNLFGEILVNRSVLEERLDRLVRLVSDVGISSGRLRDVGQKLETSFEAAALPSGKERPNLPGGGTLSSIPAFQTPRTNGKDGRDRAYLDDFDVLELDRYTEFHQLSRGLIEGISDMITLSAEMDTIIRECEGVFAREGRLNTTFQDRLMKARLVPISSMVPRLYRASRSVAIKQHKEFELVLEGEETEVDRTVFEEIAGPLLHLMRNAVTHALETPDVRETQGKARNGQIKLSAAYEGNQVVITVRDDGQGIDPEKVRNSAIARGIIRPDQHLSEPDVIELIFQPGFSTAAVLSEESGRGVGLDVVRDSVSRLRGTLEVESMPGQGTAFTMKFPTSLAIQSAMMVKVDDQQFAIPTAVVESIGRLDSYKRTVMGGRPAIIVRNEHYPLTPLAQYLSMPVNAIDDKAPMLLVNTGRHRMALIVDDIRGKMDVVMKNLGPHLRNVHGIAGGTVLGNGRVVLILEIGELLNTRSLLIGSPLGSATTGQQNVLIPTAYSGLSKGISISPEVNRSSTSALSPVSTAPAEQGKHLLVVDDSPSVRRVVSNMLKQHNWEVQTARDGVEALEMITREAPAAVLLDIEMPRMDGYELMATVRAQDQYRNLPLVVLTSRAAAKHQQRAMQLGASAYVVKPYQDEELLNTLNMLVYGTTKR